MKKGHVTAAVFFLLGFMALRLVHLAEDKSPTNDEFFHHLANGFSYWAAPGDFRMNPASPPLPRMATALPLIFLGAKAPLRHESWSQGNSPEFARQFFNVENEGRLDEFFFWARIPIILLSLFLGWLVFLWSRELFGDAAALGSLVLYTFCPDILAHSALATADLAVSAFFFLTLFLFWRYLKEPSGACSASVGFATAFSLLSKFSAVLLFPILPLVAWASGRWRILTTKTMLIFLTTCFIGVWAGYLFEVKPLLKNTPDPPKKEAFLRKIGGEGLVRFGNQTPVPLATFISSVGSMAFTREKGTHAFLLGKWSDAGWWYYYFVAFAIKNTIPFLILCFLALLFARRYLPDRIAGAVLWIPVAFFFLVTLRDKAQAGIRYFLPIYPLLFVACGGVMAWLSKRKAGFVLCALLLTWHAGEALAIHPNEFSYFNEFIGGPANGYRYLRDSNIDWGQDFKGLAKVIHQKGYGEVALFFYGPANPSWYKIRYRMLEDSEFESPKNTVYAIGTHNIDAVKWTDRYEPDARVGYSIFIYDFRNKRL